LNQLMIVLLSLQPAGDPVPRTAEEVIAAGQARIRALVGPRGCDPAEAPDEIVVCGQTDAEEQARYRVPPSPDTSPAARAGGEQLSPLGVGSSPCDMTFRQRCNGGIDVIGAVAKILSAIRHAATRD